MKELMTIGRPFFSTKEVAGLLGVDPKTVRRYVREGILDGTRIGRDYRILSESVAALVPGSKIAAPPPRPALAPVSAIVNQKGGVGKTATAHNLAAGLKLMGRRVLLIDLDPQAHLTVSLGLVPDSLATSVYQVLLGSSTAAAAITQTPRGLDVIPSTLDLSGAEIELSNERLRDFLLKDGIEGLREKYDHIVIDCPPSLGLLTINALVAATQVLIPVQCEFLSTRGLSLIQKTIRHIQHPRLNPDLKIGMIIPTMYDSRKVHHREVLEELRRLFSDLVFDPPIKTSVRITEAPAGGLSVIEYEPSGDAAESYIRLAEEVDGNG